MKQIRIILIVLMLFPALYIHGQELAESAAEDAAVSINASDSALQALADSVTPIELTYPQILLDMPNVHVQQDSLVTLLMEEKIAGMQRGEHECAGFRVQIYSSNHPRRGKSEALLLEQRVKETVNVPVYVIYATPSWKVRLGDFLTEQDAAEFRDSFKQLFPDLADYTYIVRDQVKVR